MDFAFAVQIALWIGVAIAVGEHISIIFSESIRADKHRRMLRGELIGHATAAVVLGVAGVMVARRAPSALLPAMMLWLAISHVQGKHRRIVLAVLRGAVVRALARGRVERAKVLGARLFDLMNVDRTLGKSRSAKWRFAKSAMVLARMREILGDYAIAERLYAWALSDFVEAGLTRDRSIRPKYLARAIDAGCGQVRAVAFRDPAKAESLLKIVEELASGAGTPDAAAKVVMAGGRISVLDAVTSQSSLADAILAKASIAVTHYDFAPAYEDRYAAFLLARRYSERNHVDSALTVSERLSRSLNVHVDVRDFFLWLRNEELRSALLDRKRKYEEARSILSTLTVEVQERLAQIAQAGNEKELLSLSDVAVGVATRLVGLTARFADRRGLVENAYDAVINLKGIAGSIRMNVAAALSAEVADGLQNEARKAVELRGRLARRWTEGAKSVAGELDAMELERLESFLIRERLRDTEAWTSWNANTRVVGECLREGERLFDFVRTALADGEQHYVMFTLSVTDGGAIRLIDLGPAAPIDAAIARWRTFVQLGANPSLKEPNTAFLQTTIIDRMLAEGASARWTIAADGALASLPFEAFFASGAKRLVEEYECAYLSTANELLLRRRARSGKGSQPVVVAAPDYECASHSSAGDALQSRIFEPLPLAELEGARVAELVGGRLFAGAEATVGRLKRVASPRILHVATHAFALDPPVTSMATAALPAIPAWERLRLADDAMLRAGLALAGVNAVCRGEAVPPDVESGVLSALEASALDLREADLVVLSACDTGRGQLHRGEGILGLKRGFSIAGARTIVISLWRVPDTQTCDLMVDFHRGVAADLTFAQALRQAKLNTMRTHPSPLYWAAFVCCGDAYRNLGHVNGR